jgi:hypothetical protein
MNRYLIAATLSLVIVSLVLVSVSPASAELIHGFVDLMSGGFDFSAQQTTHDFGLADAAVLNVFDPPLGWRIAGFQEHGVLAVPEGLDSVTVAPADTLLYGDLLQISAGVTYVVRCRDGLYAKFEVQVWEPWVTAQIEYYVQMDGTADLDNTVVVEDLSWGRIKALYSR